MDSTAYAFVFNGEHDWKQSEPDDWQLDVIELDGNEKVLGHYRIDGAICKIVSIKDKIVALSK
jgi:hypothetical protein